MGSFGNYSECLCRVQPQMATTFTATVNFSACAYCDRALPCVNQGSQGTSTVSVDTTFTADPVLFTTTHNDVNVLFGIGFKGIAVFVPAKLVRLLATLLSISLQASKSLHVCR